MTFVEKGRLLKNTKLETGQWMRFAKCFVRQDVFRTISNECEVSMNTAGFMRFWMMELVKDKLPSFEIKAGVRIQADEITWRNPTRATRRRPGSRCPDLRTDTVPKAIRQACTMGRFCILTGVNDLGDMFYDIACRGPFASDVARETLKWNVGRGPHILIELKSRRRSDKDSTSEALAYKAIVQISRRGHTRGLRGDTIVYGIVFDKNGICVRSERLSL